MAIPHEVQAERNKRLIQRMAQRGQKISIQEGSIASTILKLNRLDREEIAKRNSPPTKPKRGEKGLLIEAALADLNKRAKREDDYLGALLRISSITVSDAIQRKHGIEVTPRFVRDTQAWKCFKKEREKRKEEEKLDRATKHKNPKR